MFPWFLPSTILLYVFFPGGVSSRQLSSAYIVLLETIGPNYVHRQQQPGCASQWPHVKITHELHPRECFCTHCMFWVQNTVFSFPRVCCICFADVVCFAHCIGLSFCAGQANILVLFLVFNACGDFGQWVLHAGPQNTARSDVFD